MTPTRPLRSNGMPLVHHARRLRANLLAGNPFSSIEGLSAHRDEMLNKYMDPRTSDRVSFALTVEIDLMDMAIAGELA